MLYNLLPRSKQRGWRSGRWRHISVMSHAMSCLDMVLVSWFIEMQTELLQNSPTQSLVSNLNHAMKRERFGILNLLQIHLAMRSAEPTHAGSTCAHFLKFTRCSVSRKTKSELFFGSTSWTSWERPSLDLLFTTQKQRSGAKHTPKVPLYLPCGFTKIKSQRWSILKSLKKVKTS